jgi:hypothetical protein
MRFRHLCCVLAGLTVAGPFPLLAAEANAPKPRDACAQDVKQFCADVQPGGGRIKECMRSHASELSSKCVSALQANQAKKQAK